MCGALQYGQNVAKCDNRLSGKGRTGTNTVILTSGGGGGGGGDMVVQSFNKSCTLWRQRLPGESLGYFSVAEKFVSVWLVGWFLNVLVNN